MRKRMFNRQKHPKNSLSLKNFCKMLIEPLTEREREVLGYILENEKRKTIAEKMCISENTVKTHTAHIFEKLGVSNRAELFEMAHKE